MPKIKKSTFLNLRGEQSATLIKNSLSDVQIQRNLGVMISNNIIWKENSNRRATKALGAFFPNQAKSFAEMCYHNEKERIYWLRSTHLDLCPSDMATKQNNFSNTRESSKIGDSLDLGSKRSYCQRMKELKLLHLSLYMDMHDILMLPAMLNDKYDVVLNETLPLAYDSTMQFQSGELPIAQAPLRYTYR